MVEAHAVLVLLRFSKVRLRISNVKNAHLIVIFEYSAQKVESIKSANNFIMKNCLHTFNAT